jgi:hypothetical protein
LRAALIGVAGCACAAILYSAIDGYLRVLCVVLLLVHLGVLLHRYAQPPSCLLWRAETWLWIDSPNEHALRLQQITLWPGFILLRFRDEKIGKTRVFVMLPDSLDADSWRRLCVYLRHMPVFPESNKQEANK